MNLFLRFTLVFTFIFSTQFLFAQSKIAETNLTTIEKNEWKKDLSHHKTHLDFFKTEKENLGISSFEDLKFDKVVKTMGNWKHTKYHQFHHGIPVLNGVYILHEKAGELRKASGNILPNIDVKTTPSFTKEQAVQYAKLDALDDAKQENNGRLPEGLNYDAIHHSKPELYIADSQYPKNSGEYTLAYVFELEFHSYPPRHDQYIFDALSGNVLEVIPQVCSFEVEGTVKTRYYGEKSVLVDSIAPGQFLLQDFTRGDGVITINDYTGLPFESDNKNVDLANDFEDDAAADAHWAASRYYDWLRDSFGFNSIDNNGHELRSVIHLNEGESVVNAFWNGRFATFGDGNCSEYGPLTSIDVVSHEFTHGLTRNNSGLVYRYESGGLNESMSDMFGKGLEYYLNPNGFTWEVAHDFRRDSGVDIFRNMADPNTQNHPKYYKGRFWSSEGERVHTNSNVMNYWFHLVVDGGAGTNQNGIDFNVKKIGMDKAMQLVFTINTAYLVPNSDYQHAYESTIEVAKDLWGLDSEELVSVLEAWKAVGIALPADFTVDRDIAIHLVEQDRTICGANTTRPISVEIENLSNVALPSGTQIELGFRLNSDAGEITSGRRLQNFTLNNELLMGEKLPLTFNEELSFTNTTENRERIEVFVTNSFNDLNAINNFDYQEVSISQYDNPEAALQISRIGSEICEPNRLELSLEIRNEGCQPIPESTVMNVDLKLNSMDTTVTFDLSSELRQNRTRSFNFTFPISIVENGNLNYEGVLNYSDENSANNSTAGSTLLLQKAPSEVMEDFDNFDLTNDPYLYYQKGGRTIARPVQYLGETMLGFTGTSPGSVNISRDCQNLRKILQEHEGYDSKIQFCIDLTGVDNPALSFDLAQFSIENNYNIPKEYSSIFTVSTSDPDFEPIIIMGQNEGKIVNHLIPLPFDFNGQITLNSFTLFGTIISLPQNDFEKGNVHLLDNLLISNGPSNLIELSDNQLVNVFPNPANDVVWFENLSTDFLDFKVEIFNSLGAKIGEVQTDSGKAEWRSTEQSTGVYFYKISNKGKWIDSGKLLLN